MLATAVHRILTLALVKKKLQSFSGKRKEKAE
jgi:hypothetical protein